ncbi:MAG: 4-hydroxybenzoate octaprenyltransferase [Pseudomonadota bacterium]
MPRTDAENPASPAATPDSALPVWLKGLPDGLRPYAALARLDRPVGIWLLLLPCLMGLFFTRAMGDGLSWHDPWWAVLFAIGAVAMRGAGCTWNDISDRDIDAGVARTAARPIPSGEVTVQEAWLFLGIQLLAASLVWLLLPLDAKITALFALPLVALYPFMKRLTWWPQAWLGMTFNWGVLVGASTAASVSGQAIVFYLGLALWTIAYDTIYALQDVDDDALMGVKSTARLFGDHAVLGAFVFHMLAAAIVALACVLAGFETIGAIGAMAFLGHGIVQTHRLRSGGVRVALAVFKSNVIAGALLVAAFFVAAAMG